MVARRAQPAHGKGPAPPWTPAPCRYRWVLLLPRGSGRSEAQQRDRVVRDVHRGLDNRVDLVAGQDTRVRAGGHVATGVVGGRATGRRAGGVDLGDALGVAVLVGLLGGGLVVVCL